MGYTLKIKLKGIMKPPVWRRLDVNGGWNFEYLHYAIQSAFGWYDEHLYKFADKPYGGTFEIRNKDENDFGLIGFGPRQDIYKPDTTFIEDVFDNTYKLIYVYDFGDDWVHEITLEGRTPDIPMFPVCTGAKGACPLEDCGGPYGYEMLKEILTDNPNSKEAKSEAEYWGIDLATFDPKAVNIEEINARLRKAKSLMDERKKLWKEALEDL